MPGADQSKLARSLKGLTIGIVESQRQAAKNMTNDGLMESEEQFQVAIKGEAQEEPAWDRVRLKFGVRFVDATGQRDSAFDRPHFTYGAEVTSKDPVGIMACVMEWITNNRNETVGAVVAIGGITNLRAQKYRGNVHLTFQGYGAPLDNGEVGDTP